ncbi:hypothetical protein AB0C60_25510, partial [Streptomyces sp. NPDC048845]
DELGRLPGVGRRRAGQLEPVAGEVRAEVPVRHLPQRLDVPWLGDPFGSYTGNPAGLPVDTHEIVGMIAPRGLLIMDNPHIDWLGAKSGSVAALGGAEIYKALGAGENITYWSDVQDGTHCANRSEWRGPITQSIQKFMLGSGTAPGQFRISGKKAGNLAEWRNWQTPTLTD